MILEVECQSCASDAICDHDNEKEEIRELCGDEAPKFAFTNDKVIQEEDAEHVASESAGSVNTVSFFSVKKTLHDDSEFKTEESGVSTLEGRITTPNLIYGGDRVNPKHENMSIKDNLWTNFEGIYANEGT
jgi:hypothetical protein